MKINTQALAEQDLINIWLYTFTEWGEVQADKYLDEIEVGLKLITANPDIGSDYSFIRKGYRRLIIGHHLIFYKHDNENNIDIIRVLHENMDIQEYL